MYFLKFPDKQTFFNKCQEAGFTTVHPETQEEIIIYCSHEYSLDEIGIIYRGGETGIDPETGDIIIINEWVPIAGWHVNFIGQIPASFQEYILERPNTPERIFAGY